MKNGTLLLLGMLLALAAPAAAQGTDAGKGGAETPQKPAAQAAEKATQPAAEKAAQPAQPAAAEKTQKSGAALELARLAVCEDVEDRAPVGESDSFTGVKKLYCFTRVEGADTPTKVYHRWYVGDRMVNEIPINVKGPRWRCWSEKTILPSWTGPCRVEVATEGGDILGTKTFTLTAGDHPAAAAPAEKKSMATPEEHPAGAQKGEAGQPGGEHDAGTGHDEGGHHEGGGGD